jgi:hypothetical protein
VAGLPALAPLPTVTSHARGAIFLGELPNDPLVAETVFRDQDEAKTDKARFNQNAALGSRTRKLFLKGDLADGGQAPARGARGRARVRRGRGLQRRRRSDRLVEHRRDRALAPRTSRRSSRACACALKARARVLVTADHGHSPYIDKSLRAGAGKTPRYLPLGKHDAVPEGFIEIDVAGLGGPPERRAFAWRRRPTSAARRSASTAAAASRRWWCRWRGSSAMACTPTSPRGGTGEARSPKPVPPARWPRPSSRRCRLTSSRPPPSRSSRCSTGDGRRAAAAAALLARLSVDEKSVLVLLRENGSARASELAERLKKNPGPPQRPHGHAAPHAPRRGPACCSPTRSCRAVRRCTATKRRRGADGRRP